MEWNEVKCPHCKKPMQYNAALCPHCRIEATQAELTKRKQDHKAGFIGCGLIAVIAVFSLAYCSSDPIAQQASDSASVAGGASPTAMEPPPPPAPLYASIDGDEYLYSAGISKNAEDAGQVAGEFMAFRYRGLKDGKITLTSKGMTLRCDEDCTVITVTDQFGNKQHIEYTPGSVAGAAFTDAMNGLLVERPSLKKQGDGK